MSKNKTNKMEMTNALVELDAIQLEEVNGSKDRWKINAGWSQSSGFSVGVSFSF